MKGSIAAVAALLFAGGANAGSLNITYYETPSLPTSTTGNDFGPCCSSPSPATLENIAAGASLGIDGLPVSIGGPNPIIDVNGSGEILWWSPGASSPNPITGPTGSGHFTVGTVTSPYTSNMFAPNSMGANNGTDFETAVLWGTLTGPALT